MKKFNKRFILMNKFNKRFIYGSGSAAMFVGFVVLVILFNMVVGSLTDKLNLKADITENKIFKLSEQTLEVAGAINAPVDVILLETAGYEDALTRELLLKIVNLNSNFKFKVIDSNADPMAVQRYNAMGAVLSSGTIIFDNGDKFRTVASSDLRAYNSITGQNDQFQAESKLTAALISLSKSGETSVAFTTGHGEAAALNFQQLLKDDGVAVESADTVAEGFSDKHNMYVIIAPKTDFTAAEIESLDGYLKKGNNIQVYMDLDTPMLAKLEGYLYDMGITVDRTVVLESDSSRVLYNMPYCFRPTIKSHPVTTALLSNKMYVITLANSVVMNLWDEKNGVKIESLLESSSASAAKLSNGESYIGPFKLAVMATASYGNGNTSKTLVMGSTEFFNESIMDYNKDFVLSSVNWMADGEAPLRILPKSLAPGTFMMSERDYNVWFSVVVLVIPILVLAFGLFIWLRRRHL